MMPSDYATTGWFDRPMRWAQLTLAENDPAVGQYDVDFWLDYFKRAKVRCCLFERWGERLLLPYQNSLPLYAASNGKPRRFRRAL